MAAVQYDSPALQYDMAAMQYNTPGLQYDMAALLNCFPACSAHVLGMHIQPDVSHSLIFRRLYFTIAATALAVCLESDQERSVRMADGSLFVACPTKR